MSKQVKISFKEVDPKDRESLLCALRKMGLAEISSCHDNDTNRHTHRFVVIEELGNIIVTTPDDLIELTEEKPFETLESV